jgi:hypothetical protein
LKNQPTSCAAGHLAVLRAVNHGFRDAFAHIGEHANRVDENQELLEFLLIRVLIFPQLARRFGDLRAQMIHRRNVLAQHVRMPGYQNDCAREHGPRGRRTGKYLVVGRERRYRPRIVVSMLSRDRVEFPDVVSPRAVNVVEHVVSP